MNFLEHSKKLGRILALIIILGIAGAISIITVINDSTMAKGLVNDWLKLAGIAITFYFLVTPRKNSK